MKTNKALSLVAGSIAVISIYMLVRMIIYNFMPVSSLWDWYIRDTTMSLPRGAAFLSLIFLSRYLWKVVPFDFKLKKYRNPVVFGGILIAIHAIYWLGCTGSSYPAKIAIGALFTTIFVGLFEEYAFRGTLLSGLLGFMGPLSAIILSNILFTVYHLQAQPLGAWLSIFLIGFILACMRIQGVSLFWLAVIHIIIDDLDFFVGLNHPTLLSSSNILFNIALLMFAIVIFFRKTENTVSQNT